MNILPIVVRQICQFWLAYTLYLQARDVRKCVALPAFLVMTDRVTNSGMHLS